MPRNYRNEYDAYHSSPEQREKRAARNKARRMLEKDGKVQKGDGMDVHHEKPLAKGGGTDKGNLKVVPKSKNRSFPRTRKAGMK